MKSIEKKFGIYLEIHLNIKGKKTDYQYEGQLEWGWPKTKGKGINQSLKVSTKRMTRTGFFFWCVFHRMGDT